MQYFAYAKKILVTNSTIAMKMYLASKKSPVISGYGSKYLSGENSFILSSFVILARAERKNAPNPKVMAIVETERTFLEKVAKNTPKPRKTNWVKKTANRHKANVGTEVDLSLLLANKIMPIHTKITLVAAKMLRSDNSFVINIFLRLIGLVNKKSPHFERFSLEKVATEMATAIIEPISIR